MGINIKLHKWGIKTHNRCGLCGEYEEMYVHLFCECRKVIPFWDGVKRWIHVEASTHIALSHREMLLGTPDDIAPMFDLFYYKKN